MDYDLAVIGGGSGGNSVAREAARAGAKVVLLNYVQKSTQGTTWGFGGTCINVGCVPKKLFHHAGQIGYTLRKEAEQYGWADSSRARFNWQTVVKTAGDYVKQQSFLQKAGLQNAGVKIICAFGKLAGPNTVEYWDPSTGGAHSTLTARYIVLAVGGRPTMLSDIVGGQEYGITSDDIFQLPNEPMKTLVIGGGYIAVECASFLNQMGYPVTLAVRSRVLRSFDEQCAGKVTQKMAESGITVRTGVGVNLIEKADNDMKKATFTDGSSEVFNTIIIAVGRSPATQNLGLETVGIVTNDGHIPTKNDATVVSNIFAIGDAELHAPNLTPVAIRAGELLSQRLFAGSTKQMSYHGVPTCVFGTPEYACVGCSEELAIHLYGEQNIEVYLKEFTSMTHAAALLAWPTPHDFSPTNLVKLIVKKSEPDVGRIVGCHFVGDNAAEVIQAMAIAYYANATKDMIDGCLCLHPTDAEAFIGLTVTKASGESWIAHGECGGGKCG